MNKRIAKNWKRNPPEATVCLMSKVGILSISFTHRADWNRLIGEADGFSLTGKVQSRQKYLQGFRTN
jgi:hypothetical protein